MTSLQNEAFNLYRKWQDLKGTLEFVRFIKKPTDTEIIFQMAQSFQSAQTPEVLNEILKPILESTNISEDFKNRVWHQRPSLKELANYPEGSFGLAAYHFFIHNNLDENLFPEPNFKSELDYVTSRVYQTHDFWHVLTDYGIHLQDEMALQAFAIGQYNQPISLTIIAGGIIHTLQKNPEKAQETLLAITEGFMRGQKANKLINENIFSNLKMPLPEVRKLYNIDTRQNQVSLSF